MFLETRHKIRKMLKIIFLLVNIRTQGIVPQYLRRNYEFYEASEI